MRAARSKDDVLPDPEGLNLYSERGVAAMLRLMDARTIGYYFGRELASVREFSIG